jgi:CheY-like chemotaxis protein
MPALRDGRRVEIRALRPEDKDELLAAIGRIGTDSLYRRFVAVKRELSEEETAFSVSVNFVSHVALVAVVEEDGKPAIVAGGRYIIGTKRESGSVHVTMQLFNLNNESGIELRRRLKAAGISLPVIYVSANDDPVVRRATLESGCVAYLTKPFSAQSLIESLKRAAGLTQDVPGLREIPS